MYRIVTTTIDCRRCGAAFGDAVQFKTGDDGLEAYDVGDVVLDVEPGEHEGYAEAFCPTCRLEHAVANNAACFELLVESMRQGLQLWPASGCFDPRVGRVVVVRTSEAPLTVADVEAAAARPQQDMHNLNFGTFWHDHDVVDDGEHISKGSSWPARSTWWSDHRDAVAVLLVERGWPDGACSNLDVPVVVDVDHVLHVELYRARPG